MKRWKRFLKATGTACLLVLASCTPAARQTAAPTVALEHDLPHKVAILPFSNRSSDPRAAEVERRMFYNFFSSLNYVDSELSVVDETLREHHLFKPLSSGQPVSAETLGQVLGVDGIIEGEITRYGKTYALVYAEAQTGLKARMRRTSDGTVVWQHEDTAHIRKGDVPLSLVGLAGAVVKTLISHQQQSEMQAAANLSMKMVATIPNPARVREAPPTIKVVVHNGAGSLLRTGDTLKVVLIGDPDQEAAWELSPSIGRQPMAEHEPGVYTGAYRVRRGDKVAYGRVVGHLRSRQGAENYWIDVLGPVAIGDPVLLPQDISTDVTLDPAQGPYLVDRAIVVRPGVTLTVNPGTVIWFRRLGLAVRGNVHVRGTSEHPVRFLGLGSNRWKGIIIDRSKGDNRFSYCLFSGAESGLRTRQSNLALRACLFENNQWGVVIEGGSARIDQTIIRASEQVGLSARNASIRMQLSTVSQNSQGGVLVEATDLKIEQCNLVDNGQWELMVEGTSGKVQLEDNWWGGLESNQIRIRGITAPAAILSEPVETPHLEMEL